MTLFKPSRLVFWPLAAVGVAALSLGALLAAPTNRPPPLASVESGAEAIDQSDLPDLARFQARDGTWLAYRLYPAAGDASDRVAILAHGSSGCSQEMNALGHALAAAGVTAVAIDARGHGASGNRGDAGYVGQLDDDLADLVADLRRSRPRAGFALIGFSAGGGFALRVAGGPTGALFDKFVLLAPFLGHFAPTNRPNEGGGHWVEADIPRILALKALEAIGLDGPRSLPVIAFADTPGSLTSTSVYSYNLWASYGPPPDWRAAFRAAAGRIEAIVGQEDQLMNAPTYAPALAPLGAKATVLPGVDHIGMVYRPAALAAIVAAVRSTSKSPKA
jgi:alpha-beta hydrolase superfamily lysophospholipase